MGTEVGGYAVALLLVVCGATAMLLAFSRKFQVYLSLGESARNWLRLLNASPSAAQIGFSTPFGYQAKLDHHRGWYRTGGGQLVRGRASRVHVAPDQIARLGYSDGWNGPTILDTSTFCLQETDASEAVDYLSRAGRYELVFSDDRFKSRDGYPMNCHLSVHFWIGLDLKEVQHIDRLVEQMPSLQRDIEQRVAGLLREEFSGRDYRQAFYEVPLIVNRLNAGWASNEDLVELLQMLQVHFTALVVKPREEAERRFLATPGAGEERLRDRIRRVREDVKQEEQYWNARRDDLHTTLLHALDELAVYPPRAIEESLGGLRATVGEMGSGGHVVQSVEGMFLNGQRALARGADKIVDGLHRLRQLIEDLAAEDSQLRAALTPAPPEPDAKSARDSRIVHLPPDIDLGHVDLAGNAHRENNQSSEVRL